MPDSLAEARRRVRERVEQLPDEVKNCERCGSHAAMQLRRSSLNEVFLADDVGLKCESCEYYATHGISFDDPDRFHHELEELRDGERVLDFARDGPSEQVAENLAALGYTAAAKEADR